MRRQLPKAMRPPTLRQPIRPAVMKWYLLSSTLPLSRQLIKLDLQTATTQQFKPRIELSQVPEQQRVGSFIGMRLRRVVFTTITIDPAVVVSGINTVTN